MSRSCKLLLLVATLLLGSCAKKSGDDTPPPATNAAEAPLLALCNAIDYSDTTRLHNRKSMDRLIKTILHYLPNTDSASADKALHQFYTEISSDETAIETAAELTRRYLNNPASPVRDETLYIRLLNSMLSVDSLPLQIRTRAEYELRTAMLNRPGAIASDFEFIDRDGIRGTLHEVKGKKTLLIFYDPECPHCSEIINQIATNPKIQAEIERKTLTVLAIYTEGNKENWKRTAGSMPRHWIVGCDLSDIVANDIYDLPAMPLLYLLDSDKRVILKDPDVNSRELNAAI